VCGTLPVDLGICHLPLRAEAGQNGVTSNREGSAMPSLSYVSAELSKLRQIVEQMNQFDETQQETRKALRAVLSVMSELANYVGHVESRARRAG
jgi:hypothetical protein